jgi:micrococcal nuclease
VELVKDVSNTDKYGRLLRYVYVGDIFVNLDLVKGGFARVRAYKPDTKHHTELLKAMNIAAEEKRGLWGTCN